MIKLYYVRGINRYDTPYFPNITAQEDYFEGKVYSSLDAWYPPHYDNTIRLTSEDINFNKQINYLSLEFNGKLYYYFIDDIRYIDEDTLEIDITMDVIQTYMFNIDWINSTVSRRLIDRWEGDAINRKYIREQLGNGLFDTITYYEVPYNYPHIVLTSAKSLGDTTIPATFIYDNQLINDTTYTYLVIDTFKDNMKYQIYTEGNDLYLGTSYKTKNVMKWNDAPEIERAYMFMYYQLGTITETGTGELTKLVLSNSYAGTSFVASLKGGLPRDPYCQIDTVIVTPDKYTITTPFVKNTSATASFHKKYIPQLLDENFMRIKFGERLGYTTYPTSLMVTKSLIGTAINDYKTGNRIFKLEQDSNEKDKYMTTCINNTQENVTLINDAFKTYIANNQGQLVMGIAKASIGATIGLSMIPKPTPTFTPKTHKLSKAYIAREEMYNRRVSNQLTADAMSAGNVFEGAINSAFQPDTTKQGNNVTSDIYANALKRFYSIEMCTDIDDVAKILEGYGYAVHESYGAVNLFDKLNTRTYFNVIKVDKLEIGLTQCLNDDTTISEIIDRMEQGIRLWNVDIGAHLYEYDNVEKDFVV